MVLAKVLVVALLTADDPPKKEEAPPPDRIVLWNTHNGPESNCGAKTANVFLLAKSGHVIWKKLGVEVPWDPKEDRKVEIPYQLGKRTKVERIRVEIIAWHREAGGLSEIQF